MPVEETVRAFDRRARRQGAARRGVQRAAASGWRESLRARRARGAGALRVAAAALQPRRARGLRARVRADRGDARARRRAVLRARERLPDRQVPRRRERPTARAPRRRRRYLDARGEARARRAGRRSPPRTTSTVAAVAIAWLLAKPGVAAPIASARTPEQLAAVLPGVDLQLTADEIARLDEASALMDATRQTFLDELYAHGRAHDEQREDRLAAPAQRRARDRRAARRARARDGRHARARDRHLQRLLDDLARRRRRGRRRHGRQPRDRGRAHRRGARQPHPGRRRASSSSCARRTPPRRSRRSPTARST